MSKSTSTGRPIGVGGALSPAEKAELYPTALELKSRGASYRQIGKELSIAPNTARRLLEEAADAITAKDRNRVRSQVEASADAIKRRAWTELDRRVPLTEAQEKRGLDPKKQPRIIQPTSHNLPHLLGRILEADDRLIRLYGLDQPAKDEQPMESLADQMRAYERAKREGKLHEIRPAHTSNDGSISS